jgi:hypothetical protein
MELKGGSKDERNLEEEEREGHGPPQKGWSAIEEKEQEENEKNERENKLCSMDSQLFVFKRSTSTTGCTKINVYTRTGHEGLEEE